MSSPAWATNPITVWELAGSDSWGVPTYSAPRVIYGTYENGSRSQVDDSGVQFMPRQRFFLLEAVAKGVYIKAGDHSALAAPPQGTGVVRKTVEYAPAPAYGRTVPQYEALTE